MRPWQTSPTLHESPPGAPVAFCLEHKVRREPNLFDFVLYGGTFRRADTWSMKWGAMTKRADEIDAGIVVRAAAGSRPEAERVAELIFRTVAAVLGPRSPNCYDVAQEAVLRLVRKVRAGTFDSAKEGKASSWVVKLAVRVAIDHVRVPERIIEHEEALESEAEPTATVEEQLEQARAKRLVQALVERLNANDRAILLLRFWEECSYEEIGGVLSLPAGTVKSRLSRAVEHLKKEIDAQSGEARQSLRALAPSAEG